MANQPETREFQAEVKQILDIVVHSLYTDREIFLRELVSNASDALEKLRHTQLTEPAVFDDNLPLEINVSTDDAAGTITIQDFGIGMTHDELVENLGTIAHSGSKAFLKALEAGGQKNENLIGQFGVGFYSAFMVADEVRVYTHSWNKEAPGYCWTSDGSGRYRIEEVEGQRRGAKIVLTLKKDYQEFSKAERVKQLLKTYSSFVPFPLNVNGEKVNTVGALWLRNPAEINQEEYTEFYKFQANAFDEPRFHLHFNADAPLAINALLFVPGENIERFGFGRMEPGVALYCRKILIAGKPENLLPDWLRFLRGVVDSADLSLNISRESMQDSELIRKLGRLLTKRFLKTLEDKDKKDPAAYREFWNTFGHFLKEGIVSDFAQREPLAKLLRYESSLTEAGKLTSLADYVSRMPETQKDIYFLFGSSRQAIESGPYIEPFRARGLEVVFLYEPIDEFVAQHLGEFDGKKVVSGDRSDLELPGDTPGGSAEALPADDINALCSWAKELLGERVEAVVDSKRLSDSPALVLNTNPFMTANMRRVMRAMNPDAGDDSSPAVRFELNPGHPLIKKIHSLRGQDEALAGEILETLFDTARLSAGLVEDTSTIVTRMHQILSRL